MPAGWGTPYSHGRCKLHGGATPTHLKAAQRREAERAVALLGLPRDVEPHQALLEEVSRAAGHVEWLGEVVGRLEGHVEWLGELSAGWRTKWSTGSRGRSSSRTAAARWGHARLSACG